MTADATGHFRIAITASATDIDELGHVNNAIWVRWIQSLAEANWQALARPEDKAAYVWVVARHEIDYRGNVTAGETVTGETWIDGPPRRARFDRRSRFTGADGRVKVEARTTWVLLDRHTHEVRRLTAEIAAPFLAVDHDAVMD